MLDTIEESMATRKSLLVYLMVEQALPVWLLTRRLH